MTPAQHVLKPTDAAAVAEFADKVRAALGSDVLDMRLFGSKATGQDAPDSDIGVLVVVAEARTDVEDRILAIAFDVNLAHDVFISPISTRLLSIERSGVVARSAARPGD